MLTHTSTLVYSFSFPTKHSFIIFLWRYNFLSILLLKKNLWFGFFVIFFIIFLKQKESSISVFYSKHEEIFKREADPGET